MKSSILLFALLFASSAISAQPLALSKVQPSSGSPGDRVQLLGQGFDKSAKSYFAWGFDGQRGLVLDIQRKRSSTQLSAVVADQHASVKGLVVLWEGHRKPLRRIQLAGGAYGIRKGFVFVPTEEAQGPKFHATVGNAPGFSGRLIHGEAHLELAIPTVRSVSSSQGKKGKEDEPSESPLMSIQSITVHLGGESCGPPDEEAEGESIKVASSFKIECLGRGPCRASLSDLLSEALGGVLDPFGFKTRVERQKVILSHPASLCSSFLSVTSPTLAENKARPRQEGGFMASSLERRSAARSR